MRAYRALSRSDRNKDYGNWRSASPASPEVMLVALSSNGLAMKTAIEDQTLTRQHTIADEIRSGSAPNVADFFALRHQLILENREIDKIQELPVGCVNHSRRLASSLISAERVEAALYWFVSAPALFYLIYLIIRPLVDVLP